MNLNQLANAMKPAFLPGEAMKVKVIQQGKEPGQGLAYLDDGTMIVVEGGGEMVDREIEVVDPVEEHREGIPGHGDPLLHDI